MESVKEKFGDENSYFTIQMLILVWQLDAPIKLTVNAKEFDWKPSENKVMPETPVDKGTPVRIELVPYGTTKFRVSMFPVSLLEFNRRNQK